MVGVLIHRAASGVAPRRLGTSNGGVPFSLLLGFMCIGYGGCSGPTSVRKAGDLGVDRTGNREGVEIGGWSDSRREDSLHTSMVSEKKPVEDPRGCVVGRHAKYAGLALLLAGSGWHFRARPSRASHHRGSRLGWATMVLLVSICVVLPLAAAAPTAAADADATAQHQSRGDQAPVLAVRGAPEAATVEAGAARGVAAVGTNVPVEMPALRRDNPAPESANATISSAATGSTAALDNTDDSSSSDGGVDAGDVIGFTVITAAALGFCVAVVKYVVNPAVGNPAKAKSKGKVSPEQPAQAEI